MKLNGLFAQPSLLSDAAVRCSARCQPDDFVASLGGILGLLMGVSFISVIEVAYWFTVKLAEAVFREKEARKG